MVHGFFAMPGVLDGGKKAMAEASAWLTDIFRDA
jgi:acetyl esterase